MVICKNGKEIPLNKNQIMKEIYSPLQYSYDKFSPLLNSIIEKTKDLKLTKHHLTQDEIKENKISVMPTDIPNYEIIGYDNIVCTNEFDRKIKAEFFDLLTREEPAFIKWLTQNICHANTEKYTYVIKNSQNLS